MLNSGEVQKEKIRVFVGFFLPEEVKNKIEELQKKIPVFKGKLTERENLHLTFKFLGELSEKELNLIKEKLKEINSPKKLVSIKEIGFFSLSFIRIIWLYLDGCKELQEKIDNCLKDFFQLEHRFMSHLTIARVKSVKDKKIFIEKLKKIDLESIEFFIDNFYLVKSELKREGPEYEVLERYNLS